jgi:MFS family permease
VSELQHSSLGISKPLGDTSFENAKRESSETAVVVITSLGHTLCHVGELAITGAVFAVIAEFGLSQFQAVTLPLLGYVLMGVGALPFGYWSDRWGPVRLMRVYFVALAAAALAVACAPDVVTLFIALTVLGLAISIYHPVGLAMLSLGVAERGRAMGINGMAGSLGVATGPALGMLAVWAGDWRWAFVLLAVFSGLAFILMWFWAPAATAMRPAAQAENAGQEWMGNGTRGRRGIMTRPVLALSLLMAAMMLGGFNYRCLVTALPPFLTGTAPGPENLAAGSLTVWLALVLGAVGQYLGGWLGSGRDASRIYLLLIALLAPFALVLQAVEGSPAAVLAAGGLAVCLFALQPIENILLADWTSTSRRSLSYATKFAFTFGLGALGSPVVGAIWQEYGSLGPVFFVLTGSAAVMGVLSLAAVRAWRTAAAE